MDASRSGIDIVSITGGWCPFWFKQGELYRTIGKILDTSVAHETCDVYQKAPDLADTNFWTNLGETLENKTHDDGNGHVDDAPGWGFVNNDAHRSVI